jgi:hypothetical protein
MFAKFEEVFLFLYSELAVAHGLQSKSPQGRCEAAFMRLEPGLRLDRQRSEAARSMRSKPASSAGT